MSKVTGKTSKREIFKSCDWLDFVKVGFYRLNIARDSPKLYIGAPAASCDMNCDVSSPGGLKPYLHSCTHCNSLPIHSQLDVRDNSLYKGDKVFIHCLQDLI